MYHYIRVDTVASDTLGRGLSVTPANFKAQMDFLAGQHANPITPGQLAQALQGGAPLPARPVMLTFDDGHRDFATAAVPILLDHGFVAVSYVISGLLGQPGYMTESQVQEVAAAGMVVGAHTVHHVALANVSAATAEAEIVASKAALEQLLGRPITDFAYPYGSVDATVSSLVRAAGFRDAVSTFGGVTQSACDLFALPREEILGGDTLTAFAEKAVLAPAPPAPVARPHPTATRQLI